MLFIYYVINVYVPRVRANAYHVLTTPPRVFGDPKMCLRNIYAPNVVGRHLEVKKHLRSYKNLGTLK